MTRLCIVTQSHSRPAIGGAEQQIECLLNSLVETRRHDIYFLAHLIGTDTRIERLPGRPDRTRPAGRSFRLLARRDTTIPSFARDTAGRDLSARRLRIHRHSGVLCAEKWSSPDLACRSRHGCNARQFPSLWAQRTPVLHRETLHRVWHSSCGQHRRPDRASGRPPGPLLPSQGRRDRAEFPSGAFRNGRQTRPAVSRLGRKPQNLGSSRRFSFDSPRASVTSPGYASPWSEPCREDPRHGASSCYETYIRRPISTTSEPRRNAKSTSFSRERTCSSTRAFKRVIRTRSSRLGSARCRWSA